MATVGRPMARGAGGGIPGNDLGQGSTSPSTFAHVLGVSGATIGAVGGAADGRRNMGKTSCMHQRRVPHAGFCGGRTQYHPLSAPSTETRVVNAYVVHTQRPVVEMNVLSRFCTPATYQ